MIDRSDDALMALRDGALADFWKRCATEMERRGGVAGTVRVTDDAERRAVGRLLGRRLGATVAAVRLADLDLALGRSALGAELALLLPGLVGREIGNRPAERRARREAAEQLWADAADHPALKAHAALHGWLTALRRSGSLRRISAGQEALRLNQALDVLATLPRSEEELLAELAQRILGDPHALDVGQPAGTLTLRALALLEGEPVRGAGERRGLWYRYGVVCDRLSSTVLVLNLRASAPRPLSSFLAPGVEAGLPTALTLQQVQHWCRQAHWTPPRVLACENPSVMDKIASTLGAGASPLVCISGQMSIAARLLLRSLMGAGVEVAYHGDFDWGGVEIGNQVIRLGAVPWRYRASDYLAAARHSGGAGLQGRRVPAMWDPELAIVMERTGRTVYEEAVLSELCHDASC